MGIITVTIQVADLQGHQFEELDIIVDTGSTYTAVPGHARTIGSAHPTVNAITDRGRQDRPSRHRPNHRKARGIRVLHTGHIRRRERAKPPRSRNPRRSRSRRRPSERPPHSHTPAPLLTAPSPTSSRRSTIPSSRHPPSNGTSRGKKVGPNHAPADPQDSGRRRPESTDPRPITTARIVPRAPIQFPGWAKIARFQPSKYGLTLTSPSDTRPTQPNQAQLACNANLPLIWLIYT